MMSLVVVAGAAMQLPVGRISDLTDRRYVLAGAALGSALFALLVFLVAPRAGWLVIAMTACYGALAYTLYSIAVAHANDHASAGGIRQGFGRPAAALRLRHDDRPGARRGADEHRCGPESLFLATALAHIALAGLHAAAHQPPRAGADRGPRGVQDAAVRTRR